MKKFLVVLVVLLSMLVVPFGNFCSADSDKRPSIFIQLPKNVYYQDKTIYIYVKWVDYGDLVEMFNQMQLLSYNKVVVDLFSFGGSVFDALAMVALFEDLQRAGKIVEVRARGIVASAGLIIMMSGTTGYRYIDRLSWIMFHEMQSFKFFALESVSDQEEQAKINRRIQDTINKFVTEKTKLTPEKLSELIKKRELWCDSNDAIKYGFADKIIGQPDNKPNQNKSK